MGKASHLFGVLLFGTMSLASIVVALLFLSDGSIGAAFTLSLGAIASAVWAVLAYQRR
jgi:hypothetical protein